LQVTIKDHKDNGFGGYATLKGIFAPLYQPNHYPMKLKRLFSALYILALLSLLLYAGREAVGLTYETARYFYYAAIAIFMVGLIRIFYMILRKKK